MHLLILTGNIDTLGDTAVTINRANIVGFSLDLENPTYQFQVQQTPNAKDELDVKPSVAVQFDIDTKAQIGHVFAIDFDTNTKVVGYVADAKINDSVARDEFDGKLLSSTSTPNFSTGFGLALTDKVAKVGIAGMKMKEIPLADIQDLNDGKDGLRIVTKNAAHFMKKDDLIAWLKDDAEFKAEQVGTFDDVVTTISRPANEDVYYVSGPKTSYKVAWNGNFAVLSQKKAKFQIVGPVAGKDDTLVMGKSRDTSDGPVTELTYKPIAGNKLGYEQQAAM